MRYRDQSLVNQTRSEADPKGMYSTHGGRSRTIAIVVVGLILFAGAASGASASAAPTVRGGVSRTGSCSLSASWKLVVKRSGSGSLVVKFSVSGGPARHRWTVFLDDNGSGFYAGSRNANTSGNITVSASIADLAGSDVIGAAASDRATGETCSGRATI